MAATPQRVPESVTALSLVLADEQYRAMSAEDLLGRYLTDRDEGAFYALVRRYGPLVMRRCRAALGVEDLAQEAFQETFHRLILRGRSIRRQQAVGPWLAATARRQALNVARRERRQRARDRAWSPRPPAPDPAGVASEQEAGRAVAQALAGLPDRFRLPLELVYIDGLSHAEAASALRWPRGTLDSYIRRGLEKLRRAIRGRMLPAAVAAILLQQSAEAVPAGWLQGVVSRVGASRPDAGWFATLTPAKAWGLTAALGVVVVGTAVSIGLAWSPTPRPTPPPKPATTQFVTQEDQDRARADRVFNPLITRAEASLKAITFGNEGFVKVREVRTDPNRPAVFFDWVQRNVRDGQVTLDIRKIVEFGYDPAQDDLYTSVYSPGLNEPKTRINKDQQIIWYANSDGTRRVTMNLPGSERVWTALQAVRAEYAVGKDKLDPLLPTVAPAVAATLRRWAIGNEAAVKFTAPSYPAGWPQLGFEIRHRQVTAGRVDFDQVHDVQVSYDIGLDRFKLVWWPAGNARLAAELTPGFRSRVDPERPVGPDNPEFTIDRLDDLLAALKPMADTFRRPPKP